MSGPFKMKGSPMARNFGAPFRDNKNEKATDGKTAGGSTTLKGKLRAAKDALGDRHFIQSYSHNKKLIRKGQYKDFPSKDKD